MIFQEKLDKIVKKNNSLVCMGLDSDVDKLPKHLKKKKYPQYEFNKAIIDVTADLVCGYKPNSAFYEARGEAGIKELKITCDYIKKTHPEVIIILDAKRADIGSTNEGYVKYAFDYLGVDAITLHPYLGSEAIKPFLEREDKGCIILCRTSNPGAGEFQDNYVIPNSFRDLKMLKHMEPKFQCKQVQHDKLIPLYQYIANQVVKKWNNSNNCLLVVGATYPKELKEVRKIVGDMTLLVPGIGAQGGDVEATVKAGLNSKKAGMIINSARSIIFASKDKDFAEKAREETRNLKEKINTYR